MLLDQRDARAEIRRQAAGAHAARAAAYGDEIVVVARHRFSAAIVEAAILNHAGLKTISKNGWNADKLKSRKTIDRINRIFQD